MPENSKKQQQKSKNDPKDQRRPRQQRQQGAEKKVERKAEEPKVPLPVPTKPVYEDPGPEFYKNLKRETDEILKITEEAHSKYKKKEIQSNWSKYEMPIESYEEIDEQENLGADYEKLAQAPLSIGGHFQFKHEKLWDTDTGPSLYDKYFEINMDNLATAMSTVPFYERNNIDLSLFTQSDILTMENRSIKYKQRYYNDKSYSTSELEAHEKILKGLKEKLSECEDENQGTVTEKRSKDKDIRLEYPRNVNEESSLVVSKEDTKVPENDEAIEQTLTLEKVPDLTKEVKREDIRNACKSTMANEDINKVIENNTSQIPVLNQMNDKNTSVESKNIPVFNKERNTVETKEISYEKVDIKVIDDIDNIIIDSVTKDSPPVKKAERKEIDISAERNIEPNKAVPSSEGVKNPVIESPEDLEKWLDDFLDG